MSNLIRKSSLIYKLQHWRKNLIQEYGENDEYVRCLDSVLDVYISDAPTVDAVKVVRCKDCKDYECAWQSDNGDVFGNCKRHDIVDLRDADYCSYGEYKEELK